MIIADTGFWLALANTRDRHHAAATEALAKVSEPLVSTWLVVGETCHLLANRLSVDAELAFLDSISRGALQIFQLEVAHLTRARELVHKYRSLPMDLADASLVILAEELGTGRILSTDQRDFRTYRWKSRKPFQNLLDV